MINVENRTIPDVFQEAVALYHDNLFLMVPSDPKRDYHPGGYRITYGKTAQEVDKLVAGLAAAGYGHGHRIAILIDNRPEYVLLKLACNTLGISCVPVNPDYRPAEIAYLLEDSGAILGIVARRFMSVFDEGRIGRGRDLKVVALETIGIGGENDYLFPSAISTIPEVGGVHPETEASLLYTSGTTGRPKGCRLGQEYELVLGAWYGTRGGYLQFEEGQERLYNPLPLFHVNAGIVSLFCMLLTGNCQIQPQRFSKRNWWREIKETQATIIHYLGIVVPALMSEPPTPQDQAHRVKFGVGAGVEPTLHGPFEQRFGFPLIEIWGMTEMCRLLTANAEPRQIDTRAIGRPQTGLEVRVVDDQDRDVALGQPGEMVVRHSVETPRKGAFLGYLNQPEATEAAWRGGWFHTGDTVTQDESGMLYFVDRKKNIIRRSGENIAAAEVEATLLAHPDVAQATAIAVPDEMRDEEVYVCIVLREGVLSDRRFAISNEGYAAARRHIGQEIFDHARKRMAYYKAPGYILFVDTLPVTGTQKIQKHKLFEPGVDPAQAAGVLDFRHLKTR